MFLVFFSFLPQMPIRQAQQQMMMGQARSRNGPRTSPEYHVRSKGDVTLSSRNRRPKHSGITLRDHGGGGIKNRSQYKWHPKKEKKNIVFHSWFWLSKLRFSSFFQDEAPVHQDTNPGCVHYCNSRFWISTHLVFLWKLEAFTSTVVFVCV